MDNPSIWKDPYPFKKEDFGDDFLKITIYGLLSKANLLNLIENYIFIRRERDRATKVMARYMQYRTVEKICGRVTSTLKGEGRDKFGLVWHWAGTGKTYIMAFSAWKLLNSPETRNPSIFVMVDRKDLEEQIEKDFAFIGVPIEKIGSIDKLIEALRWGKEGKRGIFLVTVEKFAPKEFARLEKEGGKLEIERENVIVLADEVHRTQYRVFAILWRNVLKNAFVFGFTGTPLSKSDRNTFQRFCPEGEYYLDRYSMLDSLQDGFTVSLSYQSRLPEYHLKEDHLEEFRIFEEEQLKVLRTEEQKLLKKRVRPIFALVKQEKRIEEIAKDVADHFKNVVEPSGLKGMVVTIDREACVLFKQALDRLLAPEKSEIVMTFKQNPKGSVKTYLEKLEQKYGSKDIKRIHNRIIESFKSEENPKLLIVTDMLITGFDAQNLWTMYLDKPLKEHRLLQAIARTDRPFPNKKFGLINDYIGVLSDLEKAFGMFEVADAKNLRLVIRDLSREEEEFKKLLTKATNIFKGVKRDGTRESLMMAVEVLRIDPEKAKGFEALIKALMKSFEMLQGEPFLRGYLTDYEWLVQIYVAYNRDLRKISVNELKIEELSRKTIKLIQETINVKKIEESFPVINIDEKYIEALRKSPPKTRGGAIDIVTVIKHEVKAHPSSPFFLNLSKEVENAYEELRSREEINAQTIQKLLGLLEKVVIWKQKENEIGKENYPIYEAIKSVVPEIEDRKAVELIDSLFSNLRSKGLLFEDWQNQREVRKQAREEIAIMLYSKLREHKDKSEELGNKIFEAIKWIN